MASNVPTKPSWPSEKLYLYVSLLTVHRIGSRFREAVRRNLVRMRKSAGWRCCMASRCDRKAGFEAHEMVSDGVGSSGDRNFPKGFSFGMGGVPCRHT
jgi:hypothetical protein